MLSNVHPATAHATNRPRADAVGRERTSLNADWRFQRFVENPDGLSYDTLKPWILPAANDFLTGAKYEKPSQAGPGSNVTYVQDSFNDEAWEAVKLPHDWAAGGTFDAPGVEGGLGRLPITVLDGIVVQYLSKLISLSLVNQYSWTSTVLWRMLPSGSTASWSADGPSVTTRSVLISHLTRKLAITCLQSDSTMHSTRRDGTLALESTAMCGWLLLTLYM
jgi:hypothetical protein